MKKYILSIICIIAVFTLYSCSKTVNDSLTFKNLTEGSLFINFRGSIITVPAGQTTSVKEIPQGQYGYATTYEVPASATTSSEQGPLSGTVTINAGTKILIFYTSTFQNGAYKVFATLSNSDNLSQSSSVTSP